MRQQISVQEMDGTTILRVEGSATMKQCPVVRRYVEERLREGGAHIRVDLRGCTRMDSSFLGTLLVLNRLVQDREGSLRLVTPSAACRNLLQSLKVDGSLPMAGPEEAPVAPQGPWLPLAEGVRPDPEFFKRSVIEAHQELAQLPDPVGRPFREVVRHLEPPALSGKLN